MQTANTVHPRPITDTDIFAKNTVTKYKKNRVEISCKKGLWGVSSPSESDALREAGHYFLQYLEDGEYDA